MDQRFAEAQVFDIRRNEWNDDNIKNIVTKLFKTIELIDKWTFKSCEWVESKKQKRNEELKRHIYKIIRVVMEDVSGKEVTYHLQIPILIQNQFFYIGGNLKIPIFQLFDYPIIHRNNMLKFRNNTLTISLDSKKAESGVIKVGIFNKTIPFESLITCYHSKEEFDDFIKDKMDCPAIALLSEKCNVLWNNSDIVQRIEDLGSHFSTMNNDHFKKGRGSIFSLKTSYEVDHFTKKFMKTDSIIFELLNSIYEGPRKDTLIDYKRVRFIEYIFAPLIRKVYDLMLTIFQSKTVKFQISQTIVVDGCNVSDIVHFNYPINPLGEIASMCQLTLTGPGGFKKDNVPSHLRNIDETQFGRICPADTPDRDGCGVILNMVSTVTIDEDGRFDGIDENNITSFPITQVPFLDHNDQTRLQMSSNQLKQSIFLKNSENPLIRSGTEGCYLNESTFLHLAKDSGMVIHNDGNYMVVIYDTDKTCELIKIGYRDMYLGTVDYLEPLFNEEETFAKDQVLCQSRMIKDSELSLGSNLLTGIGVWKGFNYEDGIVVSKAVTENKFTSLHSEELTIKIDPGQVLLSLDEDSYSPLPGIGEELIQGQIYAKIKSLDGEDGFETINVDSIDLKASHTCRVTAVHVYPNSWNKKINEFNKFIQDLINKQTYTYNLINEKLSQSMDKETVDKFIVLNGLSKMDCTNRVGKYTFKGNKIGGIIIKLQVVYEEKIGIGDKIANRHGNKGVIAKIIDEDKMPILQDGRRLEVLLNPLGIISRMNVGQLYELHLNECLHKVKQHLKTLSDPIEKLDYYVQFVSIIDKTPDKWVTDKLVAEYNRNLYEYEQNGGEILPEDKLYLIQPPFQSIKPEDLNKAISYCDSEYKYKIFDPMTNTQLKNPLAVGNVYFLKLVHRATEKMAARSIGPYSKKTLQPLGGKSRLGGHKLGEMEVHALLAHGAKDLLTDFLTVQSDSPGLKNKLLSDILMNPELNADENPDEKPQSLRLMESYFKVMGLKMSNTKEEEIKIEET